MKAAWILTHEQCSARRRAPSSFAPQPCRQDPLKTITEPAGHSMAALAEPLISWR